VKDYKSIIKNIADCMETHSTYYRNYKISPDKIKSFNTILTVLQEEA